MSHIYVKYNPYRMETEIEVNGNSILNDSMLYKVVKGKRLQEWVGDFPQMLVDELNTVSFDVEFYGMALDWDDFEDAFVQAKERGIIKMLSLKFIEGESDEDINEKIVNVFMDLQEGPIDDFRDGKLVKAFESINNSEFPIHVVATMSSGKSTLINALLGNRLMPSKNEACTATITEILDNDNSDQFTAAVYNEKHEKLYEIPELTYDTMVSLNDDSEVYKIEAEGNIPFLDARSTVLKLIDTPGPNNSQNQEHKTTTYRAINNDSNNLILYVLNGTQLETNDDAQLLEYVAEQIKKGGKQVRDRFIFVINKMDEFTPEEEDIAKVIKRAKQYLASYGIEDPQIFPCSAYTALNIRTHLKDIVNVDDLPKEEKKKLPSAAKETWSKIDKFIDHESMHLEQYTTLSPSAKKELEFKLSQAEKEEDIKEQALIHCGIYSIEAAITAYVKKYAKTKKVKDLVESFQEVLESSQVLVKAKTQVATDEEAARVCAERSAAVKAKIADGKEAEEFKAKIAALNPMKTIEEKADDLRFAVENKLTRFFEAYCIDDILTNKSEAKRLVSQFTMMSSDAIAELSTELESVINKEIMETGEKILIEYQEKLEKIDENATDKQLDFKTVDLIKGKLNNMKERVFSWKRDEFATETVENLGTIDQHEKIYYEKVGQKEERVADGTERVKIGTKKVKVGSHSEKAGTRPVKNPERKGVGGFFKFWKPKYVEEDIYITVDDYKDEDVYETVVKYKTVMRDIYKEHKETIETFSLEVGAIQRVLAMGLRVSLDEGIEGVCTYAEEEVQKMKEQFKKMFDELDCLIQDKYTELEQCIVDQQTKEAQLEKNKKLLTWIEVCKEEINDILDI